MAVLFGKEKDDLDLERISVLRFVNEKAPVPVLKVLPYVMVCPEHLARTEQKVVEIKRRGSPLVPVEPLHKLFHEFRSMTVEKVGMIFLNAAAEQFARGGAILKQGQSAGPFPVHVY
jgi:hypothetical protein